MSIYQEEHIIFQQSLRRFAAKEILQFINEWEDKKWFPDEIFRKLGSAGFLGTLIAEAYGGSGGDYLLAAAWCEEFGRLPAVGFTTGINMHALVVAPALQRFGSPELKEQFLPQLVSGELIGAYAFTEPGAGSDLSCIRTQAVRKGDKFILNGSKIFITNGARADLIIVLAKTNSEAGYKGFTSFLVQTNRPGFSVGRTLSKLGWHSSDTAEIVFDNMEIPDSMVLGVEGEGWTQSMASLEWERLMLSLGAIGGAESCFEETVKYVNDRIIFGKSVGSFDINRSRLLKSYSALCAAKAFAHSCLKKLINKKRCRKEVSLCKLQTCQLAIDIADLCLQLHGGYGYTTEFKPERWFRDLRLNTIGGGTNEVMQKVAAGEIWR